MNTAKNKIKKDLQYYMNLPWTFIIKAERDEEEGVYYVVRVAELPGLATDGTTIENAIQCANEALTLYFSVALDQGDNIPEPLTSAHLKKLIAGLSV